MGNRRKIGTEYEQKTADGRFWNGITGAESEKLI